jgi:hypothetical protein
LAGKGIPTIYYRRQATDDGAMRVTSFLLALFPLLASAIEDPLSYRSIEPVYTLSKPDNVTTLLDFIASRSDLSKLHASLQQSGGFQEAFDTNPTWKFTFFAPNDEAFNHTGRYFETFEATPYVTLEDSSCPLDDNRILN